MKIGLIQQHNTADMADNIARLTDAIRTCAAEGASLIVLQELHNGLYFCQTEDTAVFDMAESIPGPSPAYYEKFYFTPGDLDFRPIPTSVGRLGVLVCWDQWYPEAARLMALRGADLLIYPTAIGWERSDRPEEQSRQLDAWRTVQRGHAVANGLPVITVNRVGHEIDPSGQTAGIQFWGNSFASGPQGEILTELPTDAEAIRVISVDLQRSEHVRRWWPFLRDRRIDAFGPLTRRYLDEE